MRVSEAILFRLAKAFYRTEVVHSRAMKQALESPEHHDAYRSHQIDRIAKSAAELGVSLRASTVCDLGCGTGAISSQFLAHGAEHVIGVDLDEDAIQRARATHADPRLTFLVSTEMGIPLPAGSVDTMVCYDVFEHVAEPAPLLAECRRVLRSGGVMLLGTWGWYHPFAPHLWSTVPVPWAHVVFSERTILRTARRVYLSTWYRPTMHDFDQEGRRIGNKYLADEIPLSFLNKLLLRDYERLFAESRLDYEVHPQPFGSPYARWSRVFLGVPWIREFITAYIWVVLRKPRLPSELSTSVQATPVALASELDQPDKARGDDRQ